MKQPCGVTLSIEACEIAEYLVSCPTVRDTLEGRMAGFRIEKEVALAKRGLEELVALDLVTATSGRQGNCFIR